MHAAALESSQPAICLLNLINEINIAMLLKFNLFFLRHTCIFYHENK